jgi:hypothetical protein
MSEKDDQMYIYQLFGVSTPRKIRATNDLRQKIGPVATIEEKNVLQAQRMIDKPRIDFQPYAMEYIQTVESIVTELRTMGYDRENEYNRMTVPIAQLKGQASMFGNPFVSEISAKLLRFLEHYKRLDDDVLQILEAYCRTVRLAYDRYITDGDSPEGQKLAAEMNAAAQRYISKFKQRTET